MKKLNFPLANRLFVVVALYALILGTTAASGPCSKKDAVRTAIDASYRLPVATNKLIDKVREARDRQIITVDQSKRFGEILNTVAQAEVIYVGMVKALQNAINAGGPADPVKLRELRMFFDGNIVEPFLDVLELARVLSGAQVELVLTALTAVRLLIRTIGSGIGSTFINALSRSGDPATIESLEFA